MKMMNKINRDNHYVPQMYLKQWAIDNRIKEYRLLVPHEGMHMWSNPGLSHVAVQKDLYVRVADNEELDDFEIDFNRLIETPATKLLRALCNGERLTPEEWIIMNDYIMAQYLRTPAFYLKSHDLFQKATETALNEMTFDFNVSAEKRIQKTNTKENTLLPADIKLSKGVPDVKHATLEINTIVGKNSWLMAIYNSLNSISDIRTTFRKLKWSIVTCHSNYEWPTSDNPFTVINQNGFTEFNNGLKNRQNVFVFPISPSIVLMSKPVGRFDWRIDANEQQTKSIIQKIVNNAYLYIYAKHEDKYLPSLRPRTVDLELFNKIHSMFENWYSNYKEQEGPYLHSIHGKII